MKHVAPRRRAAPRTRVLVIVALALRLFELGDRPFHHDESQDAYFSWIFLEQGDYEYNPLLHGPLRFYLTAAMYGLFGDSDFTARLAPALMGTLMVPLPYLLREQIGRVGAFAAALLLAFGPSYLYFSRFAREDIYFAAISFALLVVTFRFLGAPAQATSRRCVGALLAAALRHQGDDVHHRLRGLDVLRGRAAHAVAAAADRAGPRGRPRRLGLGAGRLPRRLHDPLHDVPHPPRRGARPLHGARLLARPARGGPRRRAAWYFYLLVLFGDEWPVLLLGAVGVVVAVRRPHAARRVPDLGVRGLAGRLLVGGREVRLARPAPAAAAAPAGRARDPADLGRAPALVREGRRRRGRRSGFAYAGYASFLVNAVNRADPRELLVVDPVGGGGQGRRRPGRRPRGARADLDHRRRLRGRDVPVGVVLPRPRRSSYVELGADRRRRRTPTC